MLPVLKEWVQMEAKLAVASDQKTADRAAVLHTQLRDALEADEKREELLDEIARGRGVFSSR
jgi:predicted ATP-binding protein involved in virulence